ncbi:uncharacterized protein E5676_scaffold451G001590 [Cucumis melo var. makuwa]|uniref:Reverse transcriptase domain-containing protein n=1 Tax=Cucumis melo var. makuwa TaxID=1194695 RepID=A0A5D3BMC3_CUCMM|nr:uncharacterized protein E5676_scaffold1923G00150 [Cucumis melo var. makuwa]TYK01579.1 uncharacterized protein E5676_scaffold451G001590 [Cucumis melo var. makuwa]
MTAFRTPKKIYYYKVIPFGLKNVGVTYQRAMQKVFDDMLHKYVGCYVDDFVVKSERRQDHLKDLKIVFDCLRKYQLRMNPLKCAFDVTSGKFLGFIVRYRGIDIDQSKIDAIQKMPRPKSLHDLRSLQGQLAYIRRFISNMASQCQPFKTLMRKGENFMCDEACQNFFDSIKKYLLNQPVLKAPVPSKPLILYITAQERSLGAFLAQEEEKGKECALYYLSRTLVEAKVNYSLIEKMCLALFFAINKLRHYMQTFTVHLVTKADPIKYVLSSTKKWRRGKHRPHFSLEHMLPYNFALAKLCSNNVAEYQALIIDLQITLEIEVSFIEIYGDSKLIINQLSLQYDVKHEYLKLYFAYARKLMERFDSVMLEHVPRTENKSTDALANLATALTMSNDVALNIPLCQRWIMPPILSECQEANVTISHLIDEED